MINNKKNVKEVYSIKSKGTVLKIKDKIEFVISDKYVHYNNMIISTN